MLLQLGAQALQIARPQRHGAAPRDAAGGVREAHELLAACLEELHDRRESLLSRPLLDAELVDDNRRAPRCSALLRHDRQRSEEPATCLCRECAGSVDAAHYAPGP